jgi:hypothetical protein
MSGYAKWLRFEGVSCHKKNKKIGKVSQFILLVGLNYKSFCIIKIIIKSLW